MGMPTTYCVCEIPLKSKSRVETPLAPETSDPEWRCNKRIQDFSLGDSLMFEVFNMDDPYRQQQSDVRGMPPVPGRRRAEESLGKAFLSFEMFYPNGFDNLLNLVQGTRPTGATLRVTALVLENSEPEVRRAIRA